jgi:hypothetical protein
VAASVSLLVAMLWSGAATTSTVPATLEECRAELGATFADAIEWERRALTTWADLEGCRTGLADCKEALGAPPAAVVAPPPSVEGTGSLWRDFGLAAGGFLAGGLVTAVVFAVLAGG